MIITRRGEYLHLEVKNEYDNSAKYYLGVSEASVLGQAREDLSKELSSIERGIQDIDNIKI